MPIRRFPLPQSPRSQAVTARPLPWLSFGAAVSAVTLCAALVAVVSAQTGPGLLGGGWLGTSKGTSLSDAFGAAPPSTSDRARPAKVLSGVGAQTFSSAMRQSALADTEIPQILPNIAPVAWDRLSAGDCITVTAKSGQTFSFRILGARPTGKPEQAGDPAKIELAVSACADMGEPVVKAVIQPTNPQAPQGTHAERIL